MNLCAVCRNPIVTNQYARVQRSELCISGGELIGFHQVGEVVLICLGHSRVDMIQALPKAKHFDVRHRPCNGDLLKFHCDRLGVADQIERWSDDHSSLQRIVGK